MVQKRKWSYCCKGLEKARCFASDLATSGSRRKLHGCPFGLLVTRKQDRVEEGIECFSNMADFSSQQSFVMHLYKLLCRIFPVQFNWFIHINDAFDAELLKNFRASDITRPYLYLQVRVIAALLLTLGCSFWLSFSAIFRYFLGSITFYQRHILS